MPSSASNKGISRIRLTLLSAKDLPRSDFFRLPNPFVRILVEGSGQCYCTEACLATLNPKWNRHFDLKLSKDNIVTITVWNERKFGRKPGSGLLGSVNLNSQLIRRLVDTGYQMLNLELKDSSYSTFCNKSKLIFSLMSRDVSNGTSVAITSNNVLSKSETHQTANDISCELPEGWEMRYTSLNRPYYVNHLTRSTHWTCPPAECEDMQTRRELYLSRDCLHPAQSDTGARAGVHEAARAGGYEVRTTALGQVYYWDSRTGTATWHDPLSVPADTDLPLPEGWESRQNSSGRVYYVNHVDRTTQFTDPRISRLTRISAVDESDLCLENEPDTNINAAESLDERVSQNADEVTESSSPPPIPARNLPPPDSVEVQSVSPAHTSTCVTPVCNTPTQSNGSVLHTSSAGTVLSHAAVEVTSNAQHLPVNSSKTATDNIQPHQKLASRNKRDLVAKMRSLRAELNLLQPQSGHCRLEVSREEVFEESYRIIMKKSAKELRRRLMVKFRGEEGLDYGGVAREWLYLLSHAMLNPYYGLFQYSRDDIYTLQINSNSSVNPEHLSYFYFVGRIIGLAIFHGHYIDGGFAMPFYKMILNKPICLSDIQFVDPDLFRSLTWIIENGIDNLLDMTFSVEHDTYGQISVRELKPGGRDIRVTDANKTEYVRLYVQLRFMEGIEQQFLSLQRGFNEIIPQNLLTSFDERELELLIGGLGKIDIVDWKNNTKLKHCSADDNVVQWFWRVVDSYSEEMRARLLQFITGSSRVPLQGFKALQGSTGGDGTRLFTIHVTDACAKQLPKSHTCFNRIDIPQYPTYEVMYDKLTQAVEETCGFAIE